MSSLVIDVTELTGNPGASKQIRLHEPLPGLRGALAYVEEDEGIEIDLVAESLLEGIAMSGRVSGTLHMTCSRCLTDYDRRFEQSVDEVFYFKAEGEDELYEVEEGTVDLEPMVRDVVVLAMPANPLHAKDCKGLCPICGVDRNKVDCGHRGEAIDIRWEPLSKLLKTEKEK